MTTVLAVPSYQADIAGVAQTTVGPPMGIAYLAGALLAADEPVALVDGNAEGLAPEALAARILALGPRLVGFTAATPTLHACAATAEALRARGFSGPVVFGGPHPSALPADTLREVSACDVAVVGEAEGRIGPLVQALGAGRPPDLPGVHWRSSGSIRSGGPPPPPPDLDALAPPARHLLPTHLYRSPDSRRATTAVATRGCPAPCSYCQVPSLAGRRVRRRDPDAVARELHDLFAAGHDHVNFVDDTFTWDDAWVRALCAALHRRPRPSWQCLTRVDRVDAELLRVMRRAGCRRVEFGIESGTEQGLARLNKHVTREQLVTAFDAARRAGLETMALAMVNAPGEDAAAHRATGRLIARLDPDQLQVSVCTPYPGTPLYDEAREAGRLRTADWSRYRFLRDVVYDNGALSADAVHSARTRLLRRFYLRPRTIARTVRRLADPHQDRRALLTAAVSGARALLRGG